jgi:hypothetical protein
MMNRNATKERGIRHRKLTSSPVETYSFSRVGLGSPFPPHEAHSSTLPSPMEVVVRLLSHGPVIHMIESF